MNFDEWLKGEIEKIKDIRATLLKEIGSVDRDYEHWLFEDANARWGFMKARQPGSAPPAQEKHPPEQKQPAEKFRPITEKQKTLIEKHLKGRAAPEITAMIRKTGKPLDKLSSGEASGIIEFIFGGKE